MGNRGGTSAPCGGKSEDEGGREVAWRVFLLAMAQGDVGDRNSFHQKNNLLSRIILF
jgi:hypothetical protein